MKTSKRLAIALLILATVLVSIAMLSSCSDCVHEWGEEVRVIEEATCQRDGLTMKTCTICGEPKVETTTKDHIFENYVDDGNVTCSTNGTKTAVCSNEGCNATHSILVSASGHVYTNYVHVDATCTLPSCEEAVCDICNVAVDTREVENPTPAKGHKFRGFEVCQNEGCTQVTEGLTLVGEYDVSAEGSNVTARVYQTSDKLSGNATKLQHRLVIEGEGATIDFERDKAPWSSFSDLITDIRYRGTITYVGTYAFYDLSKLEETTLPSYLTTVADGLFADCVKLTSVTLPAVVEVIGAGAFQGCKALTEINLDSTSLIAVNTSAFDGCEKIEAINLPDTTETIGAYAFRGCKALASFTMPESISLISSTIFDNSAIALNEYEGAKYLGDTDSDYKYLVVAKDKSITSCKVNKDTILIAYDAFVGCASLAELTVDDAATKYTANGNAIIEKETSTLVVGIATTVIPDDCSVTSIAPYAFCNLTGLKEITIPGAIETISEYAFALCTSLKSVVIENGVKAIAPYAFAGCSAIESITLPFIGVGEYAPVVEKANTFASIFGASENIPASLAKVILTDIEEIPQGAFYGCNKIKEISIPATVRSVGGSAFVGCSSLTRVNIEDISAWCTIDFADYYSNPVYVAKNIYIDEALVSTLVIPEGISEIKYAAFAGANFTEIALPESLVVIGDAAFIGCNALTSVTLPDSVTDLGAHAFAGCKAIESVTLSASLKSIKAYTFLSCESLIRITIPASCKGVDLSAFDSCRRLTYVEVEEGNTVYYSADGKLALIKNNEIVFTPNAHVPTV